MPTKTSCSAVVFTIGDLAKGRALIDSAIGTAKPATNTVANYFHEKVWNRLLSQRQIKLPMRPT